MNNTVGEWSGPIYLDARPVYQYTVSAHHVGDVSLWDGSNWVATSRGATCGGFTTREEAQEWVERQARVFGACWGASNEPVSDAKTIINDLIHAIYSQEAGWSDEIHRAVVRAIQRVEALVAANKTEHTETTAEAVESHHSITQFSGKTHWLNINESTGEIEVWLPEEPFGHISQQSIRALAEGVDVTILDLPTKDGIAVDSIIIEPRIKPIYGERDRKGFYVVPEDTNAE